MTRPSWDTRFLKLAYDNAEHGTCPRAKVGAVLVREKHQLTTGYNGAPTDIEHCEDVGCLIVDNHCVRVVHAEANAIIAAALQGVSTAGATLYVTHFPCLYCAMMLINAGVARVVYSELYNVDALAEDFFMKAGVEIVQIEKDEKDESHS